MFEKLQTGEKIHDAQRQPRTCSHLNFVKILYMLSPITTPVYYTTFSIQLIAPKATLGILNLVNKHKM